MYGVIFRRFFFPAMEYLQGTTIQERLLSLNKTQWLKKEEIEEIQAQKLRALLVHAYSNVPYYRRLFNESHLKPEDIKSRADLNKIPILTKDSIRKNLPDLVARMIPTRELMETHSSGSTGEPVRYYLDKNAYSAAWAQTFRCWGWAGYNLGDPYVKLSLNKRLTVSKKIQDVLLRTYYIYATGITEQNVADVIDSMKKFKPVLIRGYASYMYGLSKLMEKQDIGFSGAAVATTGSMLFTHYRECIERQFNCKVFDAYGGESTPISYECDTHTCYHFADEDVMTELIRDEESAAPGELGKITFTNLDNFAMPIIRYDIKDLGIMDDELCSCGRGLSVMKSIQGRDSDLILTPDGGFLVVEFFVILFEHIEGVNQFQVIQESLYELIVKIVKNPKFSERDLKYTKDQIQTKMGTEVKIRIEFVENIPVSGRSGKRRFVISKIPFKI